MPHEQETVSQALTRLAATPQLLVACDYDGTLAPIVDDPAHALPVRESIVALRVLAETPNTHVAVISGRALADLSALSGLGDAVHLVGSHGSEFDADFTQNLTREQARNRDALVDRLGAIAAGHPGTMLEAKPASVAFHYRNAADPVRDSAVAAVEAELARCDGVFIKRGKMVLEASVVETDKGTALQVLRQRLSPGAVLFIGDDITDEDAFATLRGPDVAIKVGPGDSAARLRVDDPPAVARLLAQIADARQAWLNAATAVPIEEHALLSDQRTLALVTPDARITWMCAPRIDSSALFAELLGGPGAGYFAVARADGRPPVGQAYQPGTLILDTDFGSFTATDALDCGGGRTMHRAGRSDLLRVLRGTGRARIAFAPRLDFGRISTMLRLHDDGVEILDSPEPIALRSPGIAWRLEREGDHETAVAEVDLADYPDGLVLALRLGSSSLRAAANPPEDPLAETHAYWSDWVRRLRPPQGYRDAVVRSALTLRALVQGPTGAIAAAATTSLPESIGGVRNWDYRYCWPRDAAIAAVALAKPGSLSEGMHLLDWMLVVIERAMSPEHLNPLYTVYGEQLSTEGEISELAGYAGSRPVRIGNAAARQVQLDVFGQVVDLVHELALRDAPLTPGHWRVVEAMAAAVVARWSEPDHGIWELRSYRRNHTHSRLMCWATLDRAIRASALLHGREPPAWVELRATIAHEILERGFDPNINTFTVAYGQPDIDAATLNVGLAGLLAPDDPRYLSTIEAVERELLEGGGVYRYLFDDGLPGAEGTFHLCTCWLVLSLIQVGRRDDARTLFETLLARAGRTGLLPEEYDTRAGRSLGNHPQAYSHAGVIECALALEHAQSPETPHPRTPPPPAAH
jgi:trehalose-phosphatase